MSFRDDMTHMATPDEMVCDECHEWPCDCPPSCVYDDPAEMPMSAIEAIEEEVLAAERRVLREGHAA